MVGPGEPRQPGCKSGPIGGVPPSRDHKLMKVAGFVIPGAFLFLMPKCPVCFAGYVAFLTGIGLTFWVAETLRTVTLCISGALLAVAGLTSFLAWRSSRSLA
jgi:hypothetical protein